MVKISELDADSKVDRRISSVLTEDKNHNGSEDHDGSQVLSEKKKSTRPKVERRRQIDPTTCERDYTEDEVEFMKAMDKYKRSSGRQFPTWSEVLEVVRDLGYHRD